MYVIKVRNVSEALPIGLALLRDGGLAIAPRGAATLEYPEAVTTTYAQPRERVLFDAARDANPFFHFFEALWVLQGREDVEFLAYFASNMAAYSDNGKTFHAPYGRRLRGGELGHKDYNPVEDQIEAAIRMLRYDPDTRRVVMQIWDRRLDMERMGKDLPCNDLVMLKVRTGRLNMSVANRSNDIVWGAYGANAVQFSTLQEYIATRVGVEVGIYEQVSDSYHVYTDLPYYKDWLAGHAAGVAPVDNLYKRGLVEPYPLFNDTAHEDADDNWHRDLQRLFERYKNPNISDKYQTKAFREVVQPLLLSYARYKVKDRDGAIEAAVECQADDWSLAAVQWLHRRKWR